jgi:hypothetical protein
MTVKNASGRATGDAASKFAAHQGEMNECQISGQHQTRKAQGNQ